MARLNLKKFLIKWKNMLFLFYTVQKCNGAAEVSLGVFNAIKSNKNFELTIKI